MSTLTETPDRTTAAAILAGYHRAMADYRAAKLDAERAAIREGRDALHVEPAVSFPAKTATIRACERDYPGLAREIARSAAVNRARERKIAEKVAGLCPRCTGQHAGDC